MRDRRWWWETVRGAQKQTVCSIVEPSLCWELEERRERTRFNISDSNAYFRAGIPAKGEDFVRNMEYLTGKYVVQPSSVQLIDNADNAWETARKVLKGQQKVKCDLYTVIMISCMDPWRW